MNEPEGREPGASDGETPRRLAAAEEIRLRAGSGTGHRPTTIWVVVVGDGAYVRSYTGGEGWHRVLLGDPTATVYLDGDEIPARAFRVEDAGTIDAVSEAIREKYGPSTPVTCPRSWKAARPPRPPGSNPARRPRRNPRPTRKGRDARDG